MIELDEIKGVMTDMVERITHSIMESGEDMVPVAFVFHEDGKLEIQGMVFRTKPEKQKMLAAVSHQSTQPGITAVGLLLDSYMMEVKTREEVDYIGAHGGVAAQPERKEALLIAIVEKDEIVATGCQRYDRVLESPRINWHDWVWREGAERGF